MATALAAPKTEIRDQIGDHLIDQRQDGSGPADPAAAGCSRSSEMTPSRVEFGTRKVTRR